MKRSSNRNRESEGPIAGVQRESRNFDQATTIYSKRYSYSCAVAARLQRLRHTTYDPPASYYNTATGTGATLKQQLHDIIDNHTVLSYDSAHGPHLQVTDADPNQPGHMLTVYDRTSLNVAAINPGGSIPGWDSGTTWNREHTWPQSRGVS